MQMTLPELEAARARADHAWRMYESLQMMNVYRLTPSERVSIDVQSRDLHRAWADALREYDTALAAYEERFEDDLPALDARREKLRAELEAARAA